MKKNIFLFLFGLFSIITFSQQTLIKGSIKNAINYEPIPDAIITIEETGQTTKSDINGEFVFSNNVPLGEQVLRISKKGYTTKRYPIIVNNGKVVNIQDMTLSFNASNKNLFTIILSDDELNNDTTELDNISGFLSSSQDVFQRAVAFEWSSSFFRLRGLDSDHSSVLINGIEMSKLYNGRPQWSNWGGLNDILRNQELTTGLTPSSYNFGGILGTTNIGVRASQYKAGGRVTYSSSNRSYASRIMVSYSTGLRKDRWAFTVMLGKRWANEGYQDATVYDANSFFASVEKRINNKHSINFTGIYAPNRRGKSSPNTQEVYDLKDVKYNEYWGWQDDKKRNSRIKETDEPIFMLNHYWNLNSITSLNTNVAYQFGKLGHSRLDYNGNTLVNGFPEGGGANPSPTYYQKLPSYFERNFPDDLEFAYGAQQAFLNKGQIDWARMYEANISNAQNGRNTIYALYEDRSDDKQFTVNSILNIELKDNILFNASVSYKHLRSENFAEILDLLGGSGYLDIDGFATEINEVQNDLQNPNKVVGEGEKFKYNFNLYANIINAYAHAQFNCNKVDFYFAGSINNTQYQREGLYQNGAFPDNSLGKGETQVFMGFGVKGGLTYKITGQHLIDFNAGYMARAPSLQNTFSNARENHDVVPNITEEKISSIDASYIFRSPIIKSKITGYYTKIEDANEIAFYFADGIGGDNTTFVQEILQGVGKKHIGVELGIEAQIIPTFKLKGAVSVGQFTYNNNPNLYLTTEPDKEAFSAGFINGFKDFGTTNLKNYKLASGAQRAYAVGFEYNDPDFWWFGAMVNYLSNAYVDVSPLTRSSNFTTDFDGNTFNDYDEGLARALLKQEEFDSYFLVNLTGGKSWKIGNYYVGLFASINNLLNKVFKTGGFEQGRNANYRQLRDDKALKTSVFGSKYWYGRGATYFVNLNFRF